MIRAKNPEIYWNKHQTARWRLVAKRFGYAFKRKGRPNVWLCRQSYHYQFLLITQCFTPLMPGEEAH